MFSEMRLISGPSGKSRSGASILFSSPLSRTQFLGAGYRNTLPPRKASQARRQECGQRQLRHEHAVDEQRLRHVHVAERRVTAT